MPSVASIRFPKRQACKNEAGCPCRVRKGQKAENASLDGPRAFSGDISQWRLLQLDFLLIDELRGAVPGSQHSTETESLALMKRPRGICSSPADGTRSPCIAIPFHPYLTRRNGQIMILSGRANVRACNIQR